jgi:hypothetical protein
MTRRLGIFVALALALALTAAIGGVAIAGMTEKATANIEAGNEECGVHQPGDPVIGTAMFKRKGDLVTVKIVVKNGEPNGTYTWAIDGPGCALLHGDIFQIRANKKGHFKVTTSFMAPTEETQFFAEVHLEGPDAVQPRVSRTPLVTLP